MPRYVLMTLPGQLSNFSKTGPAPKTDPVVAFVDHTPEGIFRFHVAPHTPGTSNVLEAIHVVFLDQSESIPADLSTLFNRPHHYSKTITPADAGEPITVDATPAPAGTYNVLAILQFDA